MYLNGAEWVKNLKITKSDFLILVKTWILTDLCEEIWPKKSTLINYKLNLIKAKLININ